MPKINNKLCKSCGVPLIGKRCHALTCSASCRSKVWRLETSRPLTVKVSFDSKEYRLLLSQAKAQDLPVNQYITQLTLNNGVAN